MDTIHSNLTNDPTDPTKKELHPSGYEVEDDAARLAITTMTGGEDCYVRTTGQKWYYDGVNTVWVQH